MDEPGLDGIVERARQGDPDAFADLYRQFERRVFGLCRHMLSSREAAEDATGEVFQRVQRMIQTYDVARPFPHWLLSVASHYCVDVLRRRRVERRVFVAEEVESLPAMDAGGAGLSPLAWVLLDERQAEVRDAIAGLPEHYRLPLVLRYYSELSYDEIATQLGLTRNHVATLIFRAKQTLRRRLAGAPTGSRS